MSRSPQPLRRVQRIDVEVLPPCALVAAPMQFAMMKPAHRHGEFVTDFARQRAGLRKPEMVGIRRAAAAGQTRLGADELQVIRVAQP
jgi:hypothetical protein